MLINNDLKKIEEKNLKNINKILKNTLSLKKHFIELELEKTDEREYSNKEDFKKEALSSFIGNIMTKNPEYINRLSYDEIKDIINDFSPSRARTLIENNKKLTNNQIINLIEIFKAKKSLLTNRVFVNTDNIELLKKIENLGLLTEEQLIKNFKNYDYFYQKSNKNVTSKFLYENVNVKTSTINEIIDGLYINGNDLENFKTQLSKKIIDLENFVDYFYNDFKDNHIDFIIQNPSFNENILKKLLIKKEFSLKFLKLKLSEEFVLENYKLLNLEDIISVNNYNLDFHIKILNKMDENEKNTYFNNVLLRKTNFDFLSYEEIIKKFNFKLDSYNSQELILEDTSEKFLIKSLNKIENNIKKYLNENDDEKLNKVKEYKFNFLLKVLSINNNREKIIEKYIDYIIEYEQLFRVLIKNQNIPIKIINEKIINNEKFINADRIKDIFIQKQNIFDNNIFEKIKNYNYGENVNILISDNKYFWINKNNKEITKPFENNINIYDISDETFLFISKVYTNNEQIEMTQTKKFILTDDICLN